MGKGGFRMAFQTVFKRYELKYMLTLEQKEKILEDWILEQQQKTYVFIGDGWRNCEFKYNWLKK